MKKVISVIKKSLFVNIGLSFIKIVFGYVGHSRALLIDGIHSLSDLSTDIVVMGGSYFAAKPADEKHPYGHGKAEYLMSLFVGIVIIFLGINILIRISEFDRIKPDLIVIYVSVVTILIKLVLSEFVLLKAKTLKSSILKSSGNESRADVVTSILVLVSAILMQFNNPYLNYADIIASLLIGMFIIKVGIDVIKESASSIIGEQLVDNRYRKKLEKTILTFTDIKSVCDLVVLNYGHYYKVIIDVAMTKGITLEEAHRIIDEMEEKLKALDDRILYITVHMSPYIGEEK